MKTLFSRFLGLCHNGHKVFSYFQVACQVCGLTQVVEASTYAHACDVFTEDHEGHCETIQRVYSTNPASVVTGDVENLVPYDTDEDFFERA